MRWCVSQSLDDALLKCGRSLQFQQQSLAPEAAAVAGEIAVLADDAMTGDPNVDSILAVGIGDGSDGGRLADACGEVFVTDRRAVWDASQLPPDSFLKRCSARGDRARRDCRAW